MVLGTSGKNRGEEERPKAKISNWDGKGGTKAKTLEGRRAFRRVWAVRSTLLGERAFLGGQLIAGSPVPLCRAPLSSLLSFWPEQEPGGLALHKAFW